MTTVAGDPADHAAPICCVLFVCMGNICRSPSAEGVFRQLLGKAGRNLHFQVDSAGTHDYHAGCAPDARARKAAARRGIDIEGLRARCVTAADFEKFDYILAMDTDNLAALQALCPPASRAHVSLLMAYALSSSFRQEVPDPYYGGPQGFEVVLDMLQAGCDGLLQEILRKPSTGISSTS